MPAPQVHTIVSMPFAENTHVVWRPGRDDAVVIDPGLEPEAITDFLADRGLTAAAVLNTHGHADHIAGNAHLKHAFPGAPLVIGAGDAVMLGDSNANLSAAFGAALVSPPADRLVREGEVVEAAGFNFEVLDLPGHSPGHVVYLLREETPLLFGGDVLFRDGVGRYDFPGSDGELLFEGIRNKLFRLPPETVVYPGHGPTTTIARERRSNPFVGEGAGDY